MESTPPRCQKASQNRSHCLVLFSSAWSFHLWQGSNSALRKWPASASQVARISCLQVYAQLICNCGSFLCKKIATAGFMEWFRRQSPWTISRLNGNFFTISSLLVFTWRFYIFCEAKYQGFQQKASIGEYFQGMNCFLFSGLNKSERFFRWCIPSKRSTPPPMHWHPNSQKTMFYTQWMIYLSFQIQTIVIFCWHPFAFHFLENMVTVTSFQKIKE